VEQSVQGLRIVIEDLPEDRSARTRIVTTAADLAYQLDNHGDVEQAVELLESVRPASVALARDFPDDLECFRNAMYLGINLAGGLSDLGRLTEAEVLLRDLVAEADQRPAGASGMDAVAHLAAVARMNLTEVLLGLGQPEAAMAEIDRSLVELQRLVRAGWQGTARRELEGSLGGAHVLRATVLAHGGEHARARGDLERAESLMSADPRNQYELALAWARCAAAAEQDAALPEGALHALLDECFHRSLAALEHAVESGWNDSAALREDPEWESLRGLPEFDALLERLATMLR
ncbi:MAG TPA: hypothetical protein VMT18_00095, partial [Planctomycetota bacterium]|nr:hypothetical protein [Planctomycetota bacterium]